MLLQVVLEGEGPAVGGAAYGAAELEIVVLLVGLHVGAGRVERGERPGALGAAERLGVAVLVAGQLDAGLEGLGAVGTGVGALVAVGQQVVVVDRAGFEALAAVLALVGADARVGAHVEGQAVGDAEPLAADLRRERNVWYREHSFMYPHCGLGISRGKIVYLQCFKSETRICMK